MQNLSVQLNESEAREVRKALRLRVETLSRIMQTWNSYGGNIKERRAFLSRLNYSSIDDVESRLNLVSNLHKRIA